MNETKQKFSMAKNSVQTLDEKYDANTMNIIKQAYNIQQHFHTEMPYRLDAFVLTLRDVYKIRGQKLDRRAKSENPNFRRTESYSRFNCCVSSYIIYNMFGKDLYWEILSVNVVSNDNIMSTHYVLRFRSTGEIFDITFDQFKNRISYDECEINTELVKEPYETAENISKMMGINLKDFTGRN